MNVTSQLNENFVSNISTLNNTVHYQRSICNGSFSWYVHGPLMAFCALIIASNSIVISLMYWKESLRTLSNIILVSLAVSDLMSGFVGIPLLFTCSVTSMINLCVSSALFMRFTAVSSVLHFALVACDRYAMITYSMRYPMLVTRTRVGCALVMVWLISPVVSTVQMAWYDMDENLQEKKREDEVYFFIFIVAFFALPLLLMLCTYSYILVVSLRHIFASRARRANLGDEPNSIAYELRGTMILISMLVVFTGCWLPFYLLMLQDHISAQIISIHSWELCLFLFLRFIPPLSNPMFCALCKRDFRHALRVWIRTRRACIARWCCCNKLTRQRNENVRIMYKRSLTTGFERNGTTVETSIRLTTPSPRVFRASINQ